MSSQSTREQALELRARLKSKKPRFKRQESWRYKRVSEIWRKPNGIDSKMRIRKKGWPKLVEVGYRGPKKARNIHPSGYEDILVRNVDDLAQVNSETQAIRIAHTVGMKKRAEILSRASERHIHVLNPPLAEKKPEGTKGAVEEAAKEVEEEEKTVEDKTVEKVEEDEEEKPPNEEKRI
jgi:large subunit ribosomal protein L32e